MSYAFKSWIIAVVIFAVSPLTAMAQDTVTLPDPKVLPVAPYYDSTKASVVVVDKSAHLTHVLQIQNGQLVEVYVAPNAVGKPSTPTPSGRATVRAIVEDPVWVPPVSIDPLQRPIGPYSKNPNNPLGAMAIPTTKGLITLHGTNQPQSIGKSVSHGCVRHQNIDILNIAGMVTPGTAIYFVDRFAGTVVRSVDFLSPAPPQPKRRAEDCTPNG